MQRANATCRPRTLCVPCLSRRLLLTPEQSGTNCKRWSFTGKHTEARRLWPDPGAQPRPQAARPAAPRSHLATDRGAAACRRSRWTGTRRLACLAARQPPKGQLAAMTRARQASIGGSAPNASELLPVKPTCGATSGSPTRESGTSNVPSARRHSPPPATSTGMCASSMGSRRCASSSSRAGATGLSRSFTNGLAETAATRRAQARTPRAPLPTRPLAQGGGLLEVSCPATRLTGPLLPRPPRQQNPSQRRPQSWRCATLAPRWTTAHPPQWTAVSSAGLKRHTLWRHPSASLCSPPAFRRPPQLCPAP